MQTSETIDELVLVIHGVGDPAPGETLSLFARSIAAQDQPLREQSEVLWLDDRGEDPDRIATFATHVRTLDVRQRRTQFAEIYWGDLSRVRRGLVGALLGLVEILFGLRYIAYVAAYQSGWGARTLRHLGLVCTSILQGPVLALTAFLGLLTLALTLTQLLWPNSQGLWANTAVISGTVGVALIVSSVGQRLAQNSGIQGFWSWLHVVAGFVSGLVVVKLWWLDPAWPELRFTGPIRESLIWYSGILVTMLALMWLVQMLMVLVLAIAWLGAMISPRVHRTALHVAFLLPALAVGFWGLALPCLWLTTADTLKRFVQLAEFNELFQKAIPLLGVQFLMAMLVGVSGVWGLLRYVRWRGRYKQRRIGAHEPLPRLIVHPSLQISLAATTVLGVGMVSSISILQFSGWENDQIYGANWLTQANAFATAFMVPVGVISAMVFPHLRPVLDIILDVINHFYFRNTQWGDIVDNNQYDIRESTIEDGALYFSRRDAVQIRIKKTLEYFRAGQGGRPRLTIISHSQGTMIAVEILNDPDMAWLNTGFSEVRLVTMGSPLGHLYQHYFAHLYPDLSAPFWAPLRTRLDRWVNIYRCDDFVGTSLDFSRIADKPLEMFSNHELGPRGHLNYWADRDVLEILQREWDAPIAAQPGFRRAA